MSWGFSGGSVLSQLEDQSKAKYEPPPGPNPYLSGYDQPNGIYPGDQPSQPYGGVITIQPGSSFTAVNEQKPRDYMCAGLLVCLCCCFPIGLIAMYYANDANTKADIGKLSEARQSSQRALYWIISGTMIGLLIMICNIVYFSQYYIA